MHNFPVTVFYEDTDLAGIVYYANYFKFIERGRSTLVADAGVDQLELQSRGIVFAVRRVEADYLGSAKLGDELTVVTEIPEVSGARLTFAQRVDRGGKTLFEAQVSVVCVTNQGRPTRIPADIHAKLTEYRRLNADES